MNVSKKLFFLNKDYLSKKTSVFSKRFLYSVLTPLCSDESWLTTCVLPLELLFDDANVEFSFDCKQGFIENIVDYLCNLTLFYAICNTRLSKLSIGNKNRIPKSTETDKRKGLIKNG